MSKGNRPQKMPGDLKDQRPSRMRRTVELDVEPTDGGVVIYDDDGGSEVIGIPDPPEDVGAYARDRWRRFWRSPVSALVDMDTHGEELHHWCRLVHQREWMWQAWRKQPIVEGSHKQPITNPAFHTIRVLDVEIARLADVFGMTPMGQMRLGVEFLRGRVLERGLKGSSAGTLPSGPTPHPRK